MYFLYSLLFSLVTIVSAPFLLYRALRHKKHLPALWQRLGALPRSLKSDGRPTLWFHACSVGETVSVVPLAQALHERFPEARLVLSTITKTGQEIAGERFAQFGADNTFYFPMDLAFIADRFLNEIRPSALIIIDTEIWPNVVRQCRRRGIPVVLANGRISPKSFRTYRWLQPLLAPVFADYAGLLVKSDEDAKRLQVMGARPSRIVVTGNIKYDLDLSPGSLAEAKADALDRAFELGKSAAPVIVAGSTHEGEEQVLFDVLRRLRSVPGLSSVRLLLAPRHPERFSGVAAAAERCGLCVARRSAPNANVASADVLLLDTLGELAAAYQFGSVVFVGGSLVPIGGHSIMEPAAYGKPIAVGPYMRNLPGTIDEFLAAGAIIQIAADESHAGLQTDQLTEAFKALLTDRNAREKMGRAASEIVARSRGATRRTADYIIHVLESRRK